MPDEAFTACLKVAHEELKAWSPECRVVAMGPIGCVDGAIVVAQVGNRVAGRMVLPQHVSLILFPNAFPPAGEPVAKLMGRFEPGSCLQDR